MSKELDDIKELRCLIYSCQENYIDNAEKVFLPILDRLENALKHHEHNMSTIIPNLVKTNEEQARVIEEQRKELQALEIIRSKNVNMFLLKASFGEVFGFEMYKRNANDLITREEYDLLKELKEK